MFDTVISLSQKFVANITGFANAILDFLNYPFTIGDVTYTLFELLFTSAIVAILTVAILRFIVSLVLPS